MLESTIAGSLPKPDWLAEPEKLWAPWRFQGEALAQAQERAAAEWIKHQEDAGIDENLRWKETLGGEWRQYEEIFPALNASRIDQVSLECAGSRVPLSLMGLLKHKDVLVGSVAVTADKVETPEEVAATIRSAIQYVDAERLYPCTNCGMVPIPYEIALGKIKSLAAGRSLVRDSL